MLSPTQQISTITVTTTQQISTTVTVTTTVLVLATTITQSSSDSDAAAIYVPISVVFGGVIILVVVVIIGLLIWRKMKSIDDTPPYNKPIQKTDAFVDNDLYRLVYYVVMGTLNLSIK